MRKVIVSVPEPCHENWDAMTPVEKGRFCGSCQKTVIDFSQMSDSQMAAFFRKPTGPVCGRFHHDQLDREIIIPRKTLPWIKYFFQFSLPAFLLSIKSYSQKSTENKKETITRLNNDNSNPGLVNESLRYPSHQITGEIVDTSGGSIPFATVSVNNTNVAASSDENGKFQFDIKPKNSVFTVTAVGYEAVEQTIGEDKYFKIVMKQKNITMENVVIEVPYGNVRRLGGAWGMSMTIRKSYSIQSLKDTIAPAFSVYPNPAQPNSNVTIQSIKLEAGNYVVNIFDAKGAVVKISTMSLQDKKQTEQLAIGNLVPGTYILCLRNKQTGKQYSKKLIVQ